VHALPARAIATVNSASHRVVLRYMARQILEVKNELTPSDEPGPLKGNSSRRNTRISAKHQVTIPAGRYAGALTGIWDKDELEHLRDEWD
jgi:hypothetical protein